MTSGPPIPTRKIRVTSQIRCDLEIWKYLLLHFNGSTIIKELNWDVPDFKVFSDASGRGFGAVFGEQWIQGEFPEWWNGKPIAVKELVPVFLVVLIWHKFFENMNVLFYVDNMAVVSILNSQTSSDKDIMKMLRKIIVLAMLNNVTIQSKHIPGKYNIVTDAISRFQIEKAEKWAPWLCQNPVMFPQTFLPW